MNAYVPAGRTVAKIAVPLEPVARAKPRWVMRSTSTRDPQTVKRMQAMVDQLGRFGARAWDVLAMVSDKRWTLMQLYEAYTAHQGDIAALRAAIDDVVLAEHVPAFLAHLRAKARSADLAQHYAVYLRRLQADGIVRRSQLTVPTLSRWMDRLEGQPATRRKYAAGVSAFCTWLVRQGVLALNPMRDVEKPAVPRGRIRFLETPDAQRLADAQPSPWRELSAVLAGTALDVTPATQLTRGQVELETIEGETVWTIAHRRPKSSGVQRMIVAEWVVPYLQRACDGKLPGALLFPGTDRFNVGKQHRAACEALGIAGYWAKDARHTWAVRWARVNGAPAQAAEQLGHGDGGVLYLKTYGQYRPTTAEKAATERLAAARDRHRHSR